MKGMKDEGRTLKGMLRSSWVQLKRHMISVSYPMPRMPYYQNPITKILFRVIFSNFIGWMDSLCIVIVSIFIIIMRHGGREGLASPSRGFTLAFAVLTGLRLLAIRWHTIFQKRLVLFQFCICCSCLVVFGLLRSRSTPSISPSPNCTSCDYSNCCGTYDILPRRSSSKFF